MVTPLMLDIAAHLIADGTALRLLDWQRIALRARCDIAQQVLGHFDVRTNTRLMAWLPCPDIGTEARLVDRARDEGILIAPGSTFSIGTLPSVPGVRLSLGQTKPKALREGLEVLDKLASEIEAPMNRQRRL